MGGKIGFPNLEEKQTQTQICTKRELNPQQVKLKSCVIQFNDGNDPGYLYPINALQEMFLNMIYVLEEILAL